MFESWLTQKNAFIFRITALDNLEYILQHGISCKNCEPQNPNFVNIGAGDIISKRDAVKIDCEPYGSLSDYVPFYFAPRSPMLGSIYKQETYPQENIIYLVSKAEIVKEAEIPFVFSEGHAIMQPLRFFYKLTDLSQIDWNVMRSKYWNVTINDNDRQRKRMAEFLIHKHCPIELITGIAVKSEQKAQEVNEILDRFAKTITVKVKPDWYF